MEKRHLRGVSGMWNSGLRWEQERQCKRVKLKTVDLFAEGQILIHESECRGEKSTKRAGERGGTHAHGSRVGEEKVQGEDGTKDGQQRGTKGKWGSTKEGGGEARETGTGGTQKRGERRV